LQICKTCDHRYAKDKHRCPSCGAWNVGGGGADGAQDDTMLLSDAKVAPLMQLQTGAWDPCFGQQGPALAPTMGLVTTGVLLLGGEPGAGKSTLALQLAQAVTMATQREIIYVEEEESISELKARAVRLEIQNMQMIRVVPMGSTSDLRTIFEQRKPSAIIVDSLQGLCDTDLDAQVEFCKALKELTVSLNAPGIVISQVTKDKGFAGLMSLQHAVDTTVLFTVHEDEVREIRTVKNRFGPSGVGRFFDMTPTGLVLRDEDEDADDDEDD